MNELNQWIWKIKLAELKKNLEKNRFKVFVKENRDEALTSILELVDKNDSIGFGGSLTLSELKVPEILKERNYNIINYPDYSLPKDIMFEQRRKSLLADVFLCSSNAITMNGELVNIDGRSNRVAGMVFGPKKVIVVAGINKIVENVEQGIGRIKNYVAPQNSKRLNRDTPCITTGKCMDCNIPDRICCNTVIMRYQTVFERVNVILIKENLGL